MGLSEIVFQDAVLLALDDDRMVETEPLAVPLDDVGDVGDAGCA